MKWSKRNWKTVTIALPEYRNCQIVRWNVTTGRLRGLIFSPDNNEHNIHFVSLRQAEQAMDKARELSR